AGGTEFSDRAREAVERRLDTPVVQVLARLAGKLGVDPGRLRMRDRVADHRIPVGHSVQTLSPCAKNQVRVMTSRSVSLRMSAGKAANGAASCTMRCAAASRIFRPEERFISMDSTLPSGRMVTVSCSMP